MAFHEIRFPANLSFGSVGGPVYDKIPHSERNNTGLQGRIIIQ